MPEARANGSRHRRRLGERGPELSRGALGRRESSDVPRDGGLGEQLSGVVSVPPYMRALRRLVLLFLGLAVVSSATVAHAGRTEHERKLLAPMLLQPKWHLLAPRGVALVAVSGRDVYIGRFTGTASLIDEQTKYAVRLTPPAGCFFDTEFAPLGGSWVVAGCNSSSDELRLYSVPNGSWTRFTPDVARMCALNPACATGSSRVPCSADYRAIGNRWIEFEFACGYHSGTVTTALQQIRSGQVIVAPATEVPGGQGGGTDIVDLNSPTGTRRLCSPLRVPAYGKIALDGRFAVEESNLNENVFLEHCGSHSRMMIGRGLFSVDSGAVLMSVGSTSNAIAGLFLPSRRRFSFRLPRQLASLCAREAAFVCIQDLALTSRTVYLDTFRLQVWTANSPTLPTPNNKKTQ